MGIWFKNILRSIIFVFIALCLVSLLFMTYKVEYGGVMENFSKINDKTGEINDFPIETQNADNLVVLFSTQYRTWEKCCENQINVINRVCNNMDDCLVGIHYWNDVDSEPPLQPPMPIQKLNMKYSTSENLFSEYSSVPIEYVSTWFKRFQYSTNIAFQNAEDLYVKKYGKSMPGDQVILRFRPDFFVYDVDQFPLPPIGRTNYYISTWNTNHRPNVDVNKLEMVDIFYTTKDALLKILNYDISAFNYREGGFIETVFYDILKSLDIDIIYSFDIKFGVMRNDKLEKLSV